MFRAFARGSAYSGSISIFSVFPLLLFVYLLAEVVAWFGALFHILVHLRLPFADVYPSLALSVPFGVIFLLLLAYQSTEVVAWIGALYRTFAHLSLFFTAVYLSLAWSVPFEFFTAATP